jgi:hypothetical protein
MKDLKLLLGGIALMIFSLLTIGSVIWMLTDLSIEESIYEAITGVIILILALIVFFGLTFSKND